MEVLLEILWQQVLEVWSGSTKGVTVWKRLICFSTILRVIIHACHLFLPSHPEVWRCVFYPFFAYLFLISFILFFSFSFLIFSRYFRSFCFEEGWSKSAGIEGCQSSEIRHLNLKEEGKEDPNISHISSAKDIEERTKSKIPSYQCSSKKQARSLPNTQIPPYNWVCNEEDWRQQHPGVYCWHQGRQEDD